MRKLHLKSSGELPFFQPPSSDVQDKHWQVSVVPERLQCRAVDLGDISPANTELFLKALNSPACGIQVTKTKVLNNKQGSLKFTPPPPPKSDFRAGVLTWGISGETFIRPDLEEVQTKLFLHNPQLWFKCASIYEGLQTSCLISYLIIMMMMMMMIMIIIIIIHCYKYKKQTSGFSKRKQRFSRASGL